MQSVFSVSYARRTIALLLVGGMALTCIGCGSAPQLHANQEVNTEMNVKTMHAPLPRGATGTPSDTFVKP